MDTVSFAERPFSLNQDQRSMRDMVLDFAAEKIAPFAVEWDEKRHLPLDVIRETATLGLGGVYVQEDVGGSNLSRLDAAVIFEALATGCPATSSFITIHNMASWMIDTYGSQEQRQKWLPQMTSMEKICCRPELIDVTLIIASNVKAPPAPVTVLTLKLEELGISVGTSIT